jgi:hypothetical protein
MVIYPGRSTEAHSCASSRVSRRGTDTSDAMHNCELTRPGGSRLLPHCYLRTASAR